MTVEGLPQSTGSCHRASSSAFSDDCFGAPLSLLIMKIIDHDNASKTPFKYRGSPIFAGLFANMLTKSKLSGF